ncbi:hypothetical protein J6590_089959 [Homalodisca vitripennis]|nr:hypothetical protein J6590_089959 [Homalodisca vitripennis]
MLSSSPSIILLALFFSTSSASPAPSRSSHTQAASSEPDDRALTLHESSDPPSEKPPSNTQPGNSIDRNLLDIAIHQCPQGYNKNASGNCRKSLAILIRHRDCRFGDGLGRELGNVNKNLLVERRCVKVVTRPVVYNSSFNRSCGLGTVTVIWETDWTGSWGRR